MKFEIVDLKLNRVINTIDGNKGEADRTLKEMKDKDPNKKMWLRMATRT
jgi:transketolase N-terminal domain/subunit